MKAKAKTLSLIAAGKITRAEAAVDLGCSPRHVNRMMLAEGVSRPPGQSRIQRAAARAARAAREEKILKYIEQVRAEEMAVDTAAAKAGCSERTIYRYLSRKGDKM